MQKLSVDGPTSYRRRWAEWSPRSPSLGCCSSRPSSPHAPTTPAQAHSEPPMSNVFSYFKYQLLALPSKKCSPSFPETRPSPSHRVPPPKMLPIYSLAARRGGPVWLASGFIIFVNTPVYLGICRRHCVSEIFCFRSYFRARPVHFFWFRRNYRAQRCWDSPDGMALSPTTSFPFKRVACPENSHPRPLHPPRLLNARISLSIYNITLFLSSANESCKPMKSLFAYILRLVSACGRSRYQPVQTILYASERTGDYACRLVPLHMNIFHM